MKKKLIERESDLIINDNTNHSQYLLLKSQYLEHLVDLPG